MRHQIDRIVSELAQSPGNSFVKEVDVVRNQCKARPDAILNQICKGSLGRGGRCLVGSRDRTRVSRACVKLASQPAPLRIPFSLATDVGSVTSMCGGIESITARKSSQQ